MKPNTRIQSYFTDPVIQRSFKGHKDSITSCLFTPNMKQAISASEDANVIVWNFKPQMRPYKFIGHKGTVNDIAISPNGSMIASASSDETVRLWANSVTGNSQIIKAHAAPVKSVDFNQDGRLLATASDDKIIKIINVADRKFQASLVGHTNWVRCARFSPDSRLIGSCSDDHTVKMWDVAQKSAVHTFIDHLEDVNVIRFHPDGTCIASGSVDKKMKIWDIRSKRLIQHYDAHSASVTGISFHPTGNYLASCSMDSTIKIWDLKMGQILYTVHGHEGPVSSVTFSGCGDFFCSGGTDAILMVWKSNVKNLDEEFESLSKTETSKMKSNKKKMEEECEYILRDSTIKKSVSVGHGQKCKVTIEKGIARQGCSVPMVNDLHSMPKTDYHINKPQVQLLSQSQSSNFFSKLPEELSSTFEKMIQQLDIIAKTMKIMDQRIQTVENQVTELYNQKKSDNDKPQRPVSYYKVPVDEADNYVDNQGTGKYQMNDFQGTLHSGKYEKGIAELDYNAYKDTLKPGGDNFSSQNVFSENLGGTMGYASCKVGQEPLEKNNLEEEAQIKTNPVEIFEDVSNHAEEFNMNQEENLENPEP